LEATLFGHGDSGLDIDDDGDDGVVMQAWISMMMVMGW